MSYLWLLLAHNKDDGARTAQHTHKQRHWFLSSLPANENTIQYDSIFLSLSPRNNKESRTHKHTRSNPTLRVRRRSHRSLLLWLVLDSNS